MPAVLTPRRAAALILLFAFALRVWDFGNPVIHVDEQYYLLVGDRLLRGAAPYIDIWDRKPIGLFLIYAAIRLLPGDGVIAYQIVATLFVATTATLVNTGARRLGAGTVGALGAAAAYLLLVSLLGGRGGQAPVFYNLPVAAAALLTLRLPDLAERRAGGAIVINGFAACLLCGLAIQIKYTAAVEGMFIGGVHLWLLHRAGARAVVLAGSGLVWLLAGLAPTIAAAGYYFALGPPNFQLFWFANFTSIGLRPGYPAGELAMRLLGIVAQLSPLILCALLSRQWVPHDGVALDRWRIANGWAIAATIGVLAIGTFFDHYALPLVAPLAILAAPAFTRSRRALVATLMLGLLLLLVERIVHHDDRAGARAVARLVAVNSHGECPYVFIGDTITYELSGACLPTPYAFPNLLAYATEQGATGIDEADEVRRILAKRPPVIVTSTRRLAIWNRGSLALVKAALALDYRPVFRTPRNGYQTVIYLRDDLTFRR